MRKIALLTVLTLGILSAHAQSAQKIGYADPEYILEQMPEMKQVESELKSAQTQLRNNIDAKAQEFQKKLKEYNDNVKNMIDAVRVNTERELTQMQQNLEQLQQDAQASIQNKQLTLMQPLYQKIAKALEEVAKENGYDMILSARVGYSDVVLYGDEKIDLSDVVLKKMGITPKPAAANEGQQQTPEKKQ